MENYSALLTIINNQETLENYPVVLSKQDNIIEFLENNNKNVLKINEKTINLTRESINGTLKITFDLENTTEAIYDFKNGIIKFNVKTNEMINEKNIIIINYQLYDSKQLINTVFFKLLVKEEQK